MLVRAFNEMEFPMVKAIYQQGIDTGNATLMNGQWRDVVFMEQRSNTVGV